MSKAYRFIKKKRETTFTNPEIENIIFLEKLLLAFHHSFIANDTKN
jgi:hypothetical protein